MKSSARMKLVKNSGPPACRGTTVLETTIALTMSMVLLTSMVILYVGAARSSSREDNTLTAYDEQRIFNQKMAREMKMVGMMATEDIDGDSNDISRDVPDQIWSDSLFEDIEYANTYMITLSSDIDGDDRTESVVYYQSDIGVWQRTWEWVRDSLEWSEQGARQLANNVDHLMFIFYDRNGDPVPDDTGFPEGGFTLTQGQRATVTAIEMIMVTRTAQADNGHREFLTLPDGTYFYDEFERTVQRFMIQGRNLRVGA